MITLFDDYVIDADEYCYIMGKLKPVNVKDGDEVKVVMRINKPKYFGTLTDALQGFYSVKCKEAITVTDFDLKQALQALKSLSDEITALTQEIMSESEEKTEWRT